MKRLFLALLCLALTGVCYASQVESSKRERAKVERRPVEIKPLTARWSALLGKSKYANHYLSNHEYSGFTWGVEMELGRMYKRSNNLSWELNINHLRATDGMYNKPLQNPANTNSVSLKSCGVNYATHYNWLVGEGWMFKVGGFLDFYGDFAAQQRVAMNNANSIGGTLQVYASGGVSYKANFKNWGLRVYGNIAVPAFGLLLADTIYEGGFSSLVNQSLVKRYDNHFVGTTLHNYQGVNGELGLDFETSKVTVTLAYETMNRWWYATKVQNYRKSSFFKLGFGVNLFQRQCDKLSNRYF